MAEQELCQLKAGVTGDTYDGDGFRGRHFSKASIFCWSGARVFLLAVMMRTVSSPAIVPAISGNLDASTAAARGCAPLGGVFRTRRFSAGRTSTRNSRRARASGGSGGGSFGIVGGWFLALGGFSGFHFLGAAGRMGLGAGGGRGAGTGGR